MNFDISNMLAHIDRTIYVVIALLVGITVHEACHAYSAVWLGDPTPRWQGRTTLNPLAHLDPLGSFFMLMMVISGFGLGWGKPVQINPNNMRISPKVGFALSSVAGPISNLLLATISAIALGVLAGINPGGGSNPFGVELLQYIVQVNVILAIFNMIPIPPLDGFHTLLGILPDDLSMQLMRIEQYGVFLLLAVVFFGLGRYLYVIAEPVFDLLINMAIWIARAI